MENEEVLKEICVGCKSGELKREGVVKIGDRWIVVPTTMEVYWCTDPHCGVYLIRHMGKLEPVDNVTLMTIIADMVEAERRISKIQADDVYKELYGVPKHMIDPDDPTMTWIKRARNAGLFKEWLSRHREWANANINRLTEEEIKELGL